MINALPISLQIKSRGSISLQSDKIECLLELGECEFPGWIELEREEKAGEGYPSCWEINVWH
jgi:hypothetical protein